MVSRDLRGRIRTGSVRRVAGSTSRTMGRSSRICRRIRISRLWAFFPRCRKSATRVGQPLCKSGFGQLIFHLEFRAQIKRPSNEGLSLGEIWILAPDLAASLHAKRGAATAGAFHLRIVELETCAFEGLEVVHGASVQVGE